VEFLFSLRDGQKNCFYYFGQQTSQFAAVVRAENNKNKSKNNNFSERRLMICMIERIIFMMIRTDMKNIIDY
jgi:hypothetical protein